MFKDSELGSTGATAAKKQFIDIGPLAHIGHLYNSTVICTIRVRALQALAKHCSPETYELIKDLKDGQTDEALAALVAVDPPDMNFVTALSEVAAMMNEDGVILLEERGFKFDGLPVGEAVTSAYVKDLSSFRRAFGRRLGEEGVGGTYFFRRSERLAPKAKPRDLSSEVIEQLKEECSAYFTRRNYGPTAIIRTFESATQIGLVITHGRARTGKPAINKKEERIARFDRAEKTDVVIFDTTTRLAWILALKGDLDFYTVLLGKALFGDGRIFDRSVHLDLAFAKASNIREKLQTAGGTDVQRVLMKFRQIEGLPSGTLLQPTGRNECVTEKYPALDKAQAQGEVTSVKLGVVLADSDAPGGIIVLKDHSIHLPTALPEKIAHQVLFDLGVLKPHGN